MRLLTAAVFAVCAVVPACSAPPVSTNVVRSLCDERFWHFERILGEGTGGLEKTPAGCVVRMASADPRGMAGSWKSLKFPVQPNRRYEIRMEIRTGALEPITAKLTGTPYVLFWDARLLRGGYQPSLGRLAARDSEWHVVTQKIVVPTTARTAELLLAFAAFGGYADGQLPRVSGRARGTLWIRNVSMRPLDMAAVPPSTLRVSDTTIQTALDTVAGCLHNASLDGMFTVSDGYTLSGNIVPDLSFGLFGVRRLAHPLYMSKFRAYWEKLAAEFTAEGRLPTQRVMGQVFFPLGVDEIYSFTGDQAFLDRMLPVVDRSFDYLKQHEDSGALVRLVDYGKWRMGEGADWVDWYPTRMEGKSFNFHMWYIRALRRFAALHSELALRAPATAGEAHNTRAREYRGRAGRIEDSLRRLYWKAGFFVPNIDYGGKVADEKWMDDQVWSVRFQVATPEMTREIWSKIDADASKYEGVPIRWAGFDKPAHGKLTWFGRLGAGDILARYHSGNPARGYQLLERISEIFARDRNVYEAYDMYGDIVPGTSGWGNYTEHCGGYLWAVAEGPFGASFESDEQAVATLHPRFPEGWTSASAEFQVRGTRLRLVYQRAGDTGWLSVSASGAPQPVRIVLADGRTDVVRAGTGFARTWSWTTRAS